MAALPHAVLAARPALCLRAAQALLFVGHIEETERPLAMAEQAWRAAGDERKLGDVLVYRANIAMMQGDGPRAIALAQQALALIPRMIATTGGRASSSWAEGISPPATCGPPSGCYGRRARCARRATPPSACSTP
jgi:ATP/maltotriose-dependent transcriptional regulator MalT